jgi:hypothetical protein
MDASACTMAALPAAGEKRKLDAFFAPAPVAAKSAVAAAVVPLSSHTRDSLALLRADELLDVAAAMALRLRALESAAAAAPAAKQARPADTAPAAPAVAAALSPEQLVAQKSRVCSVALKQIRAQMKWKPSCKQGRAKWGADVMCSADIFKMVMAEHLSKVRAHFWLAVLAAQCAPPG